jgi:hypothetical protein
MHQLDLLTVGLTLSRLLTFLRSHAGAQNVQNVDRHINFLQLTVFLHEWASAVSTTCRRHWHNKYYLKFHFICGASVTIAISS